MCVCACLQRIACTSFGIFNMTAAIDFIFSLSFHSAVIFSSFCSDNKILTQLIQKKKKKKSARKYLRKIHALHKSNAFRTTH